MITIEHDADAYITCRASGTLTEADYRAAIPELENAMKLADGAPRILILLEDFRGWEIDALWQELRFDLGHRGDFGRIAVVGESTLQEWTTALTKPFFEAEVRFFDRADLPQAKDWLSA